MLRRNQPNPYNGFKDDCQRRLALNTKARCSAVIAIAAALASARVDWTETLRWLISLLH